MSEITESARNMKTRAESYRDMFTDGNSKDRGQ